MNNEFGKRLKQIRESRNMSQDELANLLGTSKQVISRYETAQRTPKITTVYEYAQKLGVSIEQLTGYTVDRDGVKYSGSHISQKEIDNDDLFEYRVSSKKILKETTDAFDEVTQNIVNVVKDLTAEEKKVILEMVKMMKRNKGSGEGKE